MIPKGTLLAFDFGLKRTGVAQGELEIGVAHPLGTLHAATREERLAAVERLVREWRPAALVVGLPLHPDGAEHEMTRAARNFAAELEKRFGLPVFLADERYTSALAESELAAQGAKGKHQADSLAAQIVLQGFLDARRAA